MKQYILKKDIICAVRIIDIIKNVLIISGTEFEPYNGWYISKDKNMAIVDKNFVEKNKEYFEEKENPQ